jgi:hypothetical protein
MPAFPDARWLELLKASAGKTFALACAFGALLLANRWEWLPPLAPWMVQLAVVGLVICTFLTIGNFLSWINKSLGVRTFIMYCIERRQAQKEVRDYIPQMTDKERQIIGYLLVKNQKVFHANYGGGHAATLISRGIIVRHVPPGQVVAPGAHIPMTIPDHVWRVFVNHKADFHYDPPRLGEQEIPPWRMLDER